ncbi:uncharacterized protein [Ptychodera flava]|uniref:uncharacterized protein n=1 Tax=Ptychodera flava TaxID=63121 RepID=UPI00396A54FA
MNFVPVKSDDSMHKQQGCMLSSQPHFVFRHEVAAISSSATSSGEESDLAVDDSEGRGPPTKRWRMGHVFLLNFEIYDIPSHIATLCHSSALPLRYGDSVPIRHILFERTQIGQTKIDGPDIDDSVMRSMQPESFVFDPVLQHVMSLYDNFSSSPILMDKDGIRRFSNTLPRQSDKVILSSHVIGAVRLLLYDIHQIYAEKSVSELQINNLIYDMISMILHQEGLSAGFQISMGEGTKVSFKICGAEMTSTTGVLLSYRSLPDSQGHSTGVERFPIVLSENKCNSPTLRRHSTSNRKVKLTSSSPDSSQNEWQELSPISRDTVDQHFKTWNVPQVIGQSMSIGKWSPFQSADCKIVYHVSMKRNTGIVIRRTHIDKTTLQDMSGSCNMKSHDDLPKSYVCSMKFDINRSPLRCFMVLYMAFKYLIKAAKIKVP